MAYNLFFGFGLLHHLHAVLQVALLQIELDECQKVRHRVETSS